MVDDWALLGWRTDFLHSTRVHTAVSDAGQSVVAILMRSAFDSSPCANKLASWVDGESKFANAYCLMVADFTAPVLVASNRRSAAGIVAHSERAPLIAGAVGVRLTRFGFLFQWTLCVRWALGVRVAGEAVATRTYYRMVAYTACGICTTRCVLTRVFALTIETG